MGNKQSNAFNQKEFDKNWQRKEGHLDGKTVWRNKSNPNHEIQEFLIYANNDHDVERQGDLFELRKNSHDLVAATHLKQTKKEGLCSSSSQGRLFLQRIPLRLSDVQHIPFPDALHLHSNLISGYKKLARKCGPFRPSEQQVGFNNLGEAKVWLSNDFAASNPGVLESSQSSMIRKIIQMAEENTDHSTMPRENPSILNYVYQNRSQVTFEEAQKAIYSFAEQYNRAQGGKVPNHLQCMRAVGIENIQREVGFGNGSVRNSTYIERPTGGYVQSDIQLRNSLGLGYENTSSGVNYPNNQHQQQSVIGINPYSQSNVIDFNSSFQQFQPQGMRTSGFHNGNINVNGNGNGGFIAQQAPTIQQSQVTQFPTVRPSNNTSTFRPPQEERVNQPIIRHPPQQPSQVTIANPQQQPMRQSQSFSSQQPQQQPIRSSQVRFNNNPSPNEQSSVSVISAAHGNGNPHPPTSQVNFSQQSIPPQQIVSQVPSQTNVPISQSNMTLNFQPTPNNEQQSTQNIERSPQNIQQQQQQFNPQVEHVAISQTQAVVIEGGRNGQSRNFIESNTTNVDIIGSLVNRNDINQHESYDNSPQKNAITPSANNNIGDFSYTATVQTTNTTVNNNTAVITSNTTTYESFNNNANYEKTSFNNNNYNNSIGNDYESKSYNVDLEDGKSSSALLAELRNMTSFNSGSGNTAAKNTTTGYGEWNSSSSGNGTSYKNDYEGGYSSTTGGAYNGATSYESNYGISSGSSNLNNQNSASFGSTDDYQSNFQKYSRGGNTATATGIEGNNLEDNLEMKYSMTQDLYDNSNPKKQSDVEYEVDYDPEILADIQRMK